jgi:hypothetical protein
MAREQQLQNEIRLALGSLPGVRLFRNNVGALKDPRGQLVTYGLCTGSSDLIGLRRVTVTPDMVGQQVAVFTALEVKRPGQTPTEAQGKFLGMVDGMGGLSGVVTSIADARGILDA